MAYSFIPAALEEHHGVGVYIRYRQRKGTHIEIISHRGPRGVHLDCPDREMFVTRTASSMHSNPMPLDGGHFDEYVDLDPFRGALSVDGVPHPIIMANAVAQGFRTKGLQYIPRRHLPIDARKGVPQVITDSGGFQVAFQRVAFIDPIDLVAHYNASADIGVALDTPPVACGLKDTLKAAKIQALNSEVMLKRADAGLSIMNVIHGGMGYMDEYRKVVERPDMDRVSISGLARDGYPPISAMEIMWKLRSGMPYQHYHGLGIQNLAYVVPFIHLAAQPAFKGALVTTDASTAVRQASFGKYWSVDLFSGGLDTGRGYAPLHRPRMFGPSPHLPCQCPLCRSLKYTDIFYALSKTGGSSAYLIALHNVYTVLAYTKRIQAMVKELDYKDFRKEILNDIPKNYHAEVLAACDYNHEMQQSGGAGKNLHSAATPRVRKAAPTDMFMSAEAAATPNFLHKVFSKYHKYHGIEKEPSDAKSDKRSKLRAKDSSAGARKAGKGKPVKGKRKG